MWELLAITMLNGEVADVAPRHIVSIIEAQDADDPGKHYTHKVHCVITLVTGKSITTEEECDDIEKRLSEIADRRIKEMRK